MKDMLAQCGRAGFHFAVIFFALFETLSKKAQKKRKFLFEMGTFEGECSHFAKNQSEVEELIEAKSQ